jgi:hypothetical protein
MRKLGASLIIGLLALVGISLPTDSRAATLHAVYVADTTDPTIGAMTQADLPHMMPTMESIARLTHMEYESAVFAGDQFSQERVIDYLQHLKVADDDVVLFYFTGHGGRDDSKPTQWPDLFFRLDDKLLDLEAVARTVADLHPRLGLVFADACNKWLENGVYDGPLMYAPEGLMPVRKVNKQGVQSLERLFRDSQGIWVVAAARPHQLSWSDDQGGYFTTALLQNINCGDHCAPNLQWQDVFRDTSLVIQSVQQPVYQLWRA